mmetsp:Transcript_22235/g.56627  ORF Transcript_22235/g.56627 Transcript_22235/m.56627 type:complete len:210 (-) Transcript_22235:792-1421(-)
MHRSPASGRLLRIHLSLHLQQPAHSPGGRHPWPRLQVQGGLPRRQARPGVGLAVHQHLHRLLRRPREERCGEHGLPPSVLPAAIRPGLRQRAHGGHWVPPAGAERPEQGGVAGADPLVHLGLRADQELDDLGVPAGGGGVQGCDPVLRGVVGLGVPLEEQADGVRAAVDHGDNQRGGAALRVAAAGVYTLAERQLHTLSITLAHGRMQI